MSKVKYSSIAMVLTVLAVLLLFTPPTLRAQEQQATETQQTAGPYEVGVLMERSTLSVGRVRFIVTVKDGASGEPVADAKILIRTKHQADGTEGWASAFSIPRFPGTYNAQTRFVTPGFYLVSVEIQGPLGDATVLLESLQILGQRSFTSGSLVFIGLTLALVAGAAYVWWSASREKKRRESLAVPRGESTDGPGNGGQD